MRKLTLFLASLCFICMTLPSIGQNIANETIQPNEKSIEQQFLALENNWMNAWKNKDEKTCREILADDFTLTSSLSSGDLVTKEQWLGALPRYNCKSFQFDKIKVRTYGQTAVVNSWYHQEADVNGKDWNGDFLITDVWAKKNDKWQVVARHASWLQKK